MKYEVPCPFPTHRSVADSFGNILGSKCIGATIRPNFSRFFLFCIAFVSFLFLLSFLISSYSSLLILLFLPLLILLIGTMLRLLILLFLYFKLFVVLWYRYVRHSEGFWRRPSLFWSICGKNYCSATIRTNFFGSSFVMVFFIFSSCYSLLIILFISLFLFLSSYI
jgi:hypothetical protein